MLERKLGSIHIYEFNGGMLSNYKDCPN